MRERTGDIHASGWPSPCPFVKDIERHATDRAIVRAILALADNLNLEIVADGVESEAQITLPRELGCTLFQGYYVGRP